MVASVAVVIELDFGPAAPEFPCRLVPLSRFGAGEKEKFDGENQLRARPQLLCYYQQ